MSTEAQPGRAGSRDPVVAFYDAHPINEEQILNTLRGRGLSLEGLTEEVLKDHDQDHFGGIEANDVLAARAGIGPHHLVLDVCSGLGGPARYLAHRIGCRVVGLDFTESRHLAAQRLTRMVGLDGLVSFRHGDAQHMPFADETFDVVVGQEAWCHVPDKARLVAECARVLKPGGVVAFTDILRRDRLTATEMERLKREMTFPVLETLDGYAALLEGRGCRLEHREDLSELWTEVLKQRLAMYRGLQSETVRRYGVEHYRKWDRTYAFFVGLFSEGKLGGGRFVARKAQRA
ncbi:MAG TPA: methyltransferase domain-containing protein [Burkholderiales bacterium]|jgi:sarcosine/dimethylglycine N-methyltransferase|nr:methyltransferase domain-containing protein [Burkholderiales bacterium]